MRKIITLLELLISFCCFPQLSEDFSNPDFLSNGNWGGDKNLFIVNKKLQLQLNNPQNQDTSYIYAVYPFKEIIEWNFDVFLSFNPSKYNYTRIYLASDNNKLKDKLNGYYVLIGNTDDEIGLYRQDGDKHTCLIKKDKRVDLSSSCSKIKVEKNKSDFKLYSCVGDETDYSFHGQAESDYFPSKSYFGISCIYTKTYSTKFAFDNIVITTSSSNNDKDNPDDPLTPEDPDNPDIPDNPQNPDNPDPVNPDDPKPTEPSNNKTVNIDSVICTSPTSIVVYFDKEIKKGTFYIQSHEYNLIMTPSSNPKIWNGSFDIPLIENKIYALYCCLMYDYNDVLQNIVIFSFTVVFKKIDTPNVDPDNPDEIITIINENTQNEYYINALKEINDGSIEINYCLPYNNFTLKASLYSSSGILLKTYQSRIYNNKGTINIGKTANTREHVKFPYILDVIITKTDGKNIRKNIIVLM
ncbi:MAG: hypothetical protein Q4F97_01495 [Bacteroidales bacterium]|nr:hypothetical protein [Bacteroidales bacterium]